MSNDRGPQKISWIENNDDGNNLCVRRDSWGDMWMITVFYYDPNTDQCYVTTNENGLIETVLSSDWEGSI